MKYCSMTNPIRIKFPLMKLISLSTVVCSVGYEKRPNAPDLHPETNCLVKSEACYAKSLQFVDWLKIERDRWECQRCDCAKQKAAETH